MSSTNPPDRPDRPARTDERSPAPEAAETGARSGPPPGEGWDDGRGHRTAGAPEEASGGRRGALPRWLLLAGVAVVVLAILGIVVVARGGGGSSDAGSCLTELSAHLPESSPMAYGSDLVQARRSGFDDEGPLEELGTSQETTGAIPDSLTQRLRYGRLMSPEAFTAKTGVEMGQIECSLSDGTRSIMSGHFDATEVSGSSVADDGDLAATDERLALAIGDADPDALLETRDGGGLGSNEDVTTVVESLREEGSYSVVVQVGNPNSEKRARAAGLGVADADGDDRALVVAWSFADDGAAKEGRADVVDRVNGALRGTVSITADDLRVEGALVRGVIPTRKAPDLTRLIALAAPLIPGDS